MLLSNLREAGGIPAAGGQIASGVLFRSAVPQRVDTQLTSWVAEHKLTRIFDLRSTEEIGRVPGFPEHCEGATRTGLPLLEGAIGRLATLQDIYLPLIERHGPTWARLAAGIAQSEVSLVHCTAGKDRTGVGVALVLLAVGADHDAVMEDYAASTRALSGPWLEDMTRRLAEHGVALTDPMRELMVGTSVEDLDRALGAARASGSIADYLLGHGLTARQLELLGERLVVS